MNNAISLTQHPGLRGVPPRNSKPVFQPDETPTLQSSVFFRPEDKVTGDDWYCHADRFKSINDPTHKDYMPKSQALAAMATAAICSVATLPYSLSVAGPLLVGTGLWATGNGNEDGLLATVGDQFTLPGTVGDKVFESVADVFYRGDGPTMTLHQDQEGLIWGVPNEAR